MTAADAAAAEALGLGGGEYEAIVEALGRAPNPTELGVFSAMWSEHCSYKSSRKWLAGLPSAAPWVVQGPGENAGAVDIGGGLATRWLKTHVEARCRPNTAHGYPLALRNHIFPALGDNKLQDVVSEDVAALHYELRAMPYVANNAIGSFRACSSWPRLGRCCRPAAFRAGMSATSGRRPASAP